MPGIATILVIVFCSLSVIVNILSIILLIRRSKADPKIGTLNIRTSESGKDLYSFDISIPLDDVPKKKHVRMDVSDNRSADI